MFQSIIQNAGTTEREIIAILIMMGIALIIGILIAVVYMKTDRQYSKNYATALVILPPMVCAVISAINGSIAAGLGIAGTFALVRFRSQQGSAKEIAVVYGDMAIGLLASTGYIFYTVVVGVLFMAILLVTAAFGFGEHKETERTYKIQIPSDFDYNEIILPVLTKYADHVKLVSVKTSEKNDSTELKYFLSLKKNTADIELIQELRKVNTGLPIHCSTEPESKNSL